MLPKVYQPSDCEGHIYALWEESGVFRADNQSKRKPFTISMPPPNATGQLHLGHAVMLALEDIFIRFARMNGKEALWLPGTDHAAIATENVVIRELKKKGIRDPRAELGREKLVAEIKKYIEGSRGTIRSQIRRMGSSCDWSRERYTMDESLNRCVNEVFKMMKNDELIYRELRVVNWDTALQTTISDDEIEHDDHEAVFYTFEYLSAKQTGGDPLYVSTSRPETKLGDTAIAVHPDDDRYKHLVGKSFTVTWPRGRTIEVVVIADHTVDPSFGTGALGVTPRHSKIDEDIWQRHKKEMPENPPTVIGEDGKIFHAIDGFGGMTTNECREAFVEGLREQGRLLKEEKYTQPLAISYRSKQPVEYLPKLQWFIDVNKEAVVWKGKKMSLKQIMQNVVISKDIKIIPERFEKTYFHWIDNLKDWCISRQIWWGHRVPAWYCTKCNKVYMAAGAESRGVHLQHLEADYVGPSECRKCKYCNKSDYLEQDEDTLDTWFSSALWTWSTLVDEDATKDFSIDLKAILERSPDYRKFHPTQIMETGYDILFFWVARMILMTTYATGQIPFETVYLHGLIRTRDGAKMSKSHPETMIDPLAMIDKYGADALRLSMIVGQSPGNDSRLYEEKIAGYRNFVNKLWNASRFVLMQCETAGVKVENIGILEYSNTRKWGLADRALLSELQKLIADVTDGLEKYRLSEVGDRLYSFLWDYFCDWYLEISKGTANLPVLIHAMRTLLILLHPYIPFVTEELWGQFKPNSAGMLIREAWPVAEKSLVDQEASDGMQTLIDVVSVLRGIRSDNGIDPGKEIEAVLVTQKTSLMQEQAEHIRRIAKVGSLTIQSGSFKGGHAATAFTKHAEVHVPLAGVIDIAKEKERLTREKEQLEKFLAGIQSKLRNDQFVAHAPEEVIVKEQQKEADALEKLKKIEEKLAMLAGGRPEGE